MGAAYASVRRGYGEPPAAQARGSFQAGQYGRREDFTEETVALVERAGFAGACAAYAGEVRRETNRFQLPRNGVPNYDGDAFARRMAKLFAA